MKSAEAFRSIGEVAALIGVAPHVLRYWETQFPMLKPMKRPDGRRYFRPPDVALAAGLVTLLREDGLTIRGARKILEADRGESVRARGTERLTRMIAEASAASPAKPIPDNPRASSPVPVPPVSATPAMAPEPALWLDRLIALARMLRQTAPDQRRWQAARPVALRLGQAMIRIP